VPAVSAWRSRSQRPQAAHRPRHDGLLLSVLITAASVQDRDAATPLLRNLRKAFPNIRLAWPTAATPGNSSPGPGPRSSSPSRSSSGPMTCTRSRSCPAGGSWRTLAWITRRRRLARPPNCGDTLPQAS